VRNFKGWIYSYCRISFFSKPKYQTDE
jgi:hypothetical protein